jgi:hypothetical protein
LISIASFAALLKAVHCFTTHSWYFSQWLTKQALYGS